MTGENIKRISLAFFVLFTCTALLFSQSLVEIAIKEKERRAALKTKGKTGVVVTNADLKKQNKLPVMAVQSPVSSPRGRTQTRQRMASRPSTQMSSQRNLAIEDQNRDVYGYRKNATKVLFFTGPVANPEFALEKPDDQFAIISENGVLDLEFSAKNGPGADIAIFARLEGGQEMAPGGNEEGGVPLMVVGVDPREGYWYGILVMNGRGDWEGIGKGRGMNSPEEFDLGEMSDIKKIRIIFKPHNNPALNVKSFRSHNEENTLGIDAVEALH